MTAYSKRVVFTMGGKGGVGKTGVMVCPGRVVCRQ